MSTRGIFRHVATEPCMGRGCWPTGQPGNKRKLSMNSIIYIVGLVVVLLFILSMLGLR